MKGEHKIQQKLMRHSGSPLARVLKSTATAQLYMCQVYALLPLSSSMHTVANIIDWLETKSAGSLVAFVFHHLTRFYTNNTDGPVFMV